MATIQDLCQHVMKEREKKKMMRNSIKMLKHLITANYSRCGVAWEL